MDIQNFTDINSQQEPQTLPLTAISDKVALDLFRAMLRVRKIEEAVIAEYHVADEIRCPVHFCIGQEAVSAALSLLLKDEDYLFSHHRSHGYYLGKRAPLRQLFGEMYGKETGANGGRAGSQDISYSAKHFYSGAILSGATVLSAGAALALQYKKSPNIVVAGFGEGATDEGVFWETINFAALRELPLILVCENNYYATYSPMSKRVAVENISEKVIAFGVKSFTIFGNDALSVYLTLSEAIDHIKSGKGPVFIEAITYRQNSHVGPEDDSVNAYRTQKEMDFWKLHDPVKILEAKLFVQSLLDENRKEAIVKEIDSEIADAFEFAKESKFPEITDWTSGNYHNQTPQADALLGEVSSSKFDQDQKDHVPAPY